MNILYFIERNDLIKFHKYNAIKNKFINQIVDLFSENKVNHLNDLVILIKNYNNKRDIYFLINLSI